MVNTLQFLRITLTDEEYTILQFLSDGYSQKEIRAELTFSIDQMRYRVQHILSKLQATTLTHAVSNALRLGLIK